MLTVIVATLLLASSALAWRSVRTGQKNFERAWSALLFKRMDKANEYFAKAADSFGQALAEQPPSRSTMFPSNLTMAGMSLYYAGRYQECIDAMDKATQKNDRIWEGFLYKGLSFAAMDEKEKVIKNLTAYIKSSPGQYTISNEVEKQLTNLETETGSLQDAITAIQKAAIDQFEDNYTLQSSPNDNEQCSGMFWWRYNKAPCTEQLPFSRQ